MFIRNHFNLLIIVIVIGLLSSGCGQKNTGQPPHFGESFSRKPKMPEKLIQTVMQVRKKDDDAKTALNAGQYAKAEAHAGELISLVKGSGEDVMGKALYAQGKESEALPWLLKSNEKSSLLVAALILLKDRSRWSQAVATYNKAMPPLSKDEIASNIGSWIDDYALRRNLHFTPDNPQPNELASAIHIGLGLDDIKGYVTESQYEMIIAEFKQALAISPKSKIAKYYYDFAIKAGEQYKAHRISREDQNYNWHIRDLKFMHLPSSENKPNGDKQISISSQIRVTNQQVLDKERATSVRSDAESALSKGDYTTAEQIALDLGVHDNGSATDLELLAKALDAQGKENEALQWYMKLGDAPQYRLPTALMLMRADRYSEAVSYYNKTMPPLSKEDILKVKNGNASDDVVLRSHYHFSAKRVQRRELATAIHIAMGLQHIKWDNYIDSDHDSQFMYHYKRALQLSPDSYVAKYYYNYGLKQLARYHAH